MPRLNSVGFIKMLRFSRYWVSHRMFLFPIVIIDVFWRLTFKDTLRFVFVLDNLKMLHQINRCTIQRIERFSLEILLRLSFHYYYHQVYQYEMRIFFFKKHVKIRRMIKSVLFKVCSIACYTFFPSFGQFLNTTPLKIFSLCCEPFIEPFFHIFVRIKALLNKSVSHRCKQVVIGRNPSWWVSYMG